MFCNSQVKRLYDLNIEYRNLQALEVKCKEDIDVMAEVSERKRANHAELVSILTSLDKRLCPHPPGETTLLLRDLANVGWGASK